MGCAVGDYDNDGKPDLAVSMDGRVLLFHNEGNRTFKDVTQESGIFTTGPGARPHFYRLRSRRRSRSLCHALQRFPAGESSRRPSRFPTDAAPAGSVLWHNNVNATFTDWTSESALGGRRAFRRSDRQRHQQRPSDRFRRHRLAESARCDLPDQREGAFKPARRSSDMPAPTAGVVALDYNKDGWMDLAFTHWGSPGLSLWRNVDGKSFDRVLAAGSGLDARLGHRADRLRQ